MLISAMVFFLPVGLVNHSSLPQRAGAVQVMQKPGVSLACIQVVT
jgi:hypothetical protein